MEGPASILKELAENALDAGADVLELEMEKDPSQGLRVQDNGKGMGPQELQLALKRHATSKIQKAQDLFLVQSLGFRGEALASIASVSQLSLASRPEDLEEGRRLFSQDAKEWQEAPWRGGPGTHVRVQELFFNVPARKQFLKSPRVEAAHCLELIQAMALANPQCSWRLIQASKLLEIA